MSEEVFKPLLSGDKYYVSNLGSIKYKKDGVFKTPYKPCVKNGYQTVMLNVIGKFKHYLVHRLVAMVWIPNPENKLQVNHIDGNKLNNRVSNLEWNTPLENIRHAIRIKLRNNGIKCNVKDIHTGEIINFSDTVELGKFLDLPSNGIMKYVERSKVLPIRNKYVINIELKDTKNTYNIKPINVYDYVKKEFKVFKSHNEATLKTGVSVGTFSYDLKYNDTYYIAGFSFSYKKIIPLTITKEQALEDRIKLYVKPRIYVSKSIELYNYETEEVITCIERDDVIKYMNTSKLAINRVLSKIEQHKRTWLLGGYGIRRVNQKYPWYPYSKKEILSTKAGNPYNHPVYILKVDNKEDELIYSSKEAMNITNLPESTFREKVLLMPNGYDFEINFIKANIRKY